MSSTSLDGSHLASDEVDRVCVQSRRCCCRQLQTHLARKTLLNDQTQLKDQTQLNDRQLKDKTRQQSQSIASIEQMLSSYLSSCPPHGHEVDLEGER